MSSTAARHWDAADTSGRVNWWSSEKCQAYYNAAVCGEPVKGSSEGCRVQLARQFPGRVFEHAVSVGCGEASKERALLADGLVRRFSLWEISERRAATGKAKAAAEGLSDRVEYRLGDAFAGSREPQYDLVYWDHSLHHMSDVEDALRWSVSVLRPGGVVLVNDYFGPNRLQFPRFEVAAANGFLDTSLGARGIRTRRIRPANPISRFRMWRRDPSEAPQSEKIAEAASRQLPGFQLAPIGGTLLNILGGVVIPAVPEDSPVIDELLARDAELRRQGSSHFGFALWSKA